MAHRRRERVRRRGNNTTRQQGSAKSKREREREREREKAAQQPRDRRRLPYLDESFVNDGNVSASGLLDAMNTFLAGPACPRRERPPSQWPPSPPAQNPVRSGARRSRLHARGSHPPGRPRTCRRGPSRRISARPRPPPEVCPHGLARGRTVNNAPTQGHEFELYGSRDPCAHVGMDSHAGRKGAGGWWWWCVGGSLLREGAGARGVSVKLVCVDWRVTVASGSIVPGVF